MFRAPNDKEYDVLVSENRFVTGIQLEIERALEMRAMTQADLARALDVSEARVSQILAGNGKNLRARTIARIAHVLGLEADLEFSEPRSNSRRCANPSRPQATREVKGWPIKGIRAIDYNGWNGIANDDECQFARAA